MKKKIITILLIISLIFIIACENKTLNEQQKEVSIEEKSEPKIDETKVLEKQEQKVEPKVEEKKEELLCTHNKNCTNPDKCIEGTCKSLDSLYKTDGCEKKCKIIESTILTSDGETYNLPSGDGSYTAASALEWTVKTSQEYCQGEEKIVPISILKRNYGEVIADEYIVLKVGETSKVITHPIQKQLKFTLTLQDVKEECS